MTAGQGHEADIGTLDIPTDSCMEQPFAGSAGIAAATVSGGADRPGRLGSTGDYYSA
jgi:hypothetical protein